MEHFNEKSAFDFVQVLYLKKYLSGHNGYIAGGCFKNIFKGEKVKDIDVFFENSEDYEKALELFNDNDDFNEVYESDNAVGFYDTKNDVVVELIKSQHGKPVEMINNFDFTITKFALHKVKAETNDEDVENFEQMELLLDEPLNEVESSIESDRDEDSNEGEDDYEYIVTYHESFFEHLMLNRLVIDRDIVDFPLNTFERIIKYSRYGYVPCTGTKAKIVRLINMVDLPEDDADLFTGFYAGID